MYFMRRYVVGYKLFFALLGFSAIVAEIATLAERGTFLAGNFFSSFTIQSNLLMCCVFIISALVFMTHKTSQRLIWWRGASTLYMIITAAVFSALLSGLDQGASTALPWDNLVLYYIVPIAAIVDWLFLDPPSRLPSFRAALTWLGYPVAYLLFSLGRGLFTDWYPYPFLNPALSNGVGVAVTAFAITAFSSALVFLMTLGSTESA